LRGCPPGVLAGRTRKGRVCNIAENLRINEQIRLSPIRLIDHENNQVGIISTDEAIQKAYAVGMDLVEVAPTERPPVCRIMDFGKWKYAQKKKQKTRGGHEIVIKEVRIRPKTDDHDRQIKVNRAMEFLKKGDKVLFTMLFRGRERFHQDVGFEAFKSIKEQLAEIGKVEREPKMEGRRMTMVMIPAKG
jgi:translation initiation factor IF-3